MSKKVLSIKVSNRSWLNYLNLCSWKEEPVSCFSRVKIILDEREYLSIVSDQNIVDCPATSEGQGLWGQCLVPSQARVRSCRSFRYWQQVFLGDARESTRRDDISKLTCDTLHNIIPTTGNA